MWKLFQTSLTWTQLTQTPCYLELNPVSLAFDPSFAVIYYLLTWTRLLKLPANSIFC